MRGSDEISHFDLLKMCHQVNAQNPRHRVVSNWKERDFVEDPSTGLAYVTYHHNIHNWTVIAFRGPNVRNLNGILNTVRVAMATSVAVIPAQYRQASRRVDERFKQSTMFDKFKKFVASQGEQNQVFLTGMYSGGDVAQYVLYELLKSVKEERDLQEVSRISKKLSNIFLGTKSYSAITFSNNGIYTLLPEIERENAVEQISQRCITYLGDPTWNTNGHIGEIRHVTFKPYSPTLVSKSKFYAGHFAKSAAVETLRISFYTWVFQLGARLVLGENSMLANTLGFFRLPFLFIMEYLGIRKMLSEINAINAEQDELSLGTSYIVMISMLIITMGPIIYKLATKLFSMSFSDIFSAPTYSLWQSKFKGREHLAESDFQRMAHWPSSTQFLMMYPRYLIQLLTPFSRLTPGFTTLFVAPEVLKKRQLNWMPGYEPENVANNRS